MSFTTPPQWDESVETLVVGSGGTGLVAALRSRKAGVLTLVLEKAAVIGGTTAVSGGVLWIPNSRPVVDAGVHTSDEKIHEYIRRIAGDRVPGEFIEAVLRVDENPIPGLYAASNGTAHVMGIGYAGGGRTIGPNVTFGYIAGAQAAKDVEKA